MAGFLELVAFAAEAVFGNQRRFVPVAEFFQRAEQLELEPAEGIRVVTEWEPIARAYAHCGDVLRVFVNLLRNFRSHFSRNKDQVSDPRISVSGRNRWLHVQITVADNGLGLPEDIVTAFNAGKEIPPEPETGRQRRGLESIRRTVTRNHGAVKVESVHTSAALSAGTVYEISLPRHDICLTKKPGAAVSSSATGQSTPPTSIFNLARLADEETRDPALYRIRVDGDLSQGIKVIFPDDFPLDKESRSYFQQGLRDLRARFLDYFDANISNSEIAVEFRDDLNILSRHQKGRLIFSWSITRRGPPVDREILQINAFASCQRLMFFRRQKQDSFFHQPGVGLQNQVVIEYIHSVPELLRATLDVMYAPSHLGKEMGITLSERHQELLEQGPEQRFTSLFPITTADYIILRSDIHARVRAAAHEDRLYSLFGRRRTIVQADDRAMPSFEAFVQNEPDPLRREFYRWLIAMGSELTLSYSLWGVRLWGADPEEDFDIIVCRGLRPDQFAGDIYLHLTSHQRRQAYLDLDDLEFLAELYRLLPSGSRPMLLVIARACLKHKYEHVSVGRKQRVDLFTEEAACQGGKFSRVGEKVFRMVDYLRKAGISLSFQPDILQAINAYLDSVNRDPKIREFPTYLQAFSPQMHLVLIDSILDKRDANGHHPVMVRAYDRVARSALGYVFVRGGERERIKARSLLGRCPDTAYADNGERQLEDQARLRLGEVSPEKQIKVRSLSDLKPLPVVPRMPAQPGQSVTFAVEPTRFDELAAYLKDNREVIAAICAQSGLGKSVEELTTLADNLRARAVGNQNRLTAEHGELYDLGVALLAMYAYGKPNSWLGTGYAVLGSQDVSKGTRELPIFGGRRFNEITATVIQHFRQEFEAQIPFLTMTSCFTDRDTQEDFRTHDNYGLNPGPDFYQQRDKNRSFNLADTSFVNTGRDNLDFSPGGHFGFILWLFLSGQLYRLIEQGKFIYAGSNVDNVVALPEPVLLSMFYLSGRTTLCEVCNSDAEGINGFLANFKAGRQPRGQPPLHLAERFEISPEVMKLLASDFKKYEKYLGLGSTNSFHFWLPGLPAMFGVEMEELEELDVAYQDSDEQKIAELVQEMEHKINDRLNQLIDGRGGVGRLVRLLGQITTLFPETLFVQVPTGAEAGALTRFEAWKKSIANLKREHQRKLADSKEARKIEREIREAFDRLERISRALSGKTNFREGARPMPRGMFYTSGANPAARTMRGRVDWELKMMADELGMSVQEGHFPDILAANERYLSEMAYLLNTGIIDPGNMKGYLHPQRLTQTPSGRRPRWGIYPIAGNPPHWMHMIGGEAAIAELWLDGIIYIVQGDDERKPDLPPWQLRHPMCQELFKAFAPFFYYSDISVGTGFDGETNIFRLLERILQEVEVYYIVGIDHYNRWAPKQ